MTEKKKAAPKKPRAKAKPKAAKKVATTAPTPEPVKEERPDWLDKKMEDFQAGTISYRAVVTRHNQLFGTMWNPWRVRPAVFYSIWKRLRDDYLANE